MPFRANESHLGKSSTIYSGTGTSIKLIKFINQCRVQLRAFSDLTVIDRYYTEAADGEMR